MSVTGKLSVVVCVCEPWNWFQSGPVFSICGTLFSNGAGSGFTEFIVKFCERSDEWDQKCGRAIALKPELYMLSYSKSSSSQLKV